MSDGPSVMRLWRADGRLLWEASFAPSTTMIPPPDAMRAASYVTVRGADGYLRWRVLVPPLGPCVE